MLPSSILHHRCRCLLSAYYPSNICYLYYILFKAAISMKVPFYSGPAYKFISVESFKLILEHETLRFTRGDSFNDPFESNPYLVPIDWKGLVKEDKSNVDLIKYIANEAFIKICSKIYTTCFSATYLDKKSHLMWSHYANSHRGLCFEVIFPEVNGINYKQGDMVPISVTYCESLFEERNKQSMDNPDLPLYMATYKSNIWEYENEVRLVLHSGVFDKNKFNLVNNDKNADVVFNIESITKVIFGSKSSVEDIQEVVKIFCKKGHLPDFYRIDLNPVSLEFYEYELSIKKDILQYNEGLNNGS